jgi:thiamine pyrophosphate-dependent acetolactate synthase large subunit-like protein
VTHIADRMDPLSPGRPGLVKEEFEREAIEGHALVARCLKGLGVTHAYGVSGAPIVKTLAACLKEGIRPIGVRNQQAAVMMATAQNYVTGRLTAVSLVSAGPAVTNTVTSLLVAWDNCWPVIVLGGRRPLSMRGIGSFQELDAVPIVHSITKWSAVVESTADIPDCIERAFSIATSGRPGPVYLDLPEDVLADVVRSYRLPCLRTPAGPLPDNERIARAAGILLDAKRPAMIIGKGIRWSEPYEELTRLVDDWGIPFITSPMGRGYLPDDHPLCFNDARGLLQSKADAVLVVGARLNWTFRFGTEFARDAQIIQIDIHEPEIGVNIARTVGLVGNAKDILRQLVSHLATASHAQNRQAPSFWHAALRESRGKKRDSLNILMSNNSVPMSPYRMLKEIRDFLPRDAICAVDGNVFMAAAQQVLPSYLPASRFTAGTNGCMGVGIPFGIGAKLSHPNRLVMTICGDAAFAFNGMDMETAVRHNVPVIIVVVNNEGICGAITQKANYPADAERITMFQPDCRYEAIMRAFGGYGEFVETPDQLRQALERAVQSGMPACINVKVDPHALYPRD